MPKRLIVVGVLLLIIAPAASAENKVEITPFIGYRFGGDFNDRWSGQSFSISSSESVGVFLDISLQDEFQLELLYSRQDSDLRRSGFFGNETVGLEIEQWMVGSVYLFEYDEPLRPFVTAGIGATHFRSSRGSVESATEFALTAAGGVKIMPSEHIGFRLEGRLYFTFVNSGGGVACGTFGCGFSYGGSGLLQGEVSAGLIFAF